MLNYARIAWDKALKESKKESTYDNVLAKFDMVCGGNEIIYLRSNAKTVWHIRMLKFGLVTHVEAFNSSWGFVVPMQAPKRVPLLSFAGYGGLV